MPDPHHQPDLESVTDANAPTRWIAHVDLDAFYASCEQRDQPEYRGRPVVVGALPGGRGVVAAASYEARKFGIHSAMPIADAHRRCPDAVFLRPDMEKYRRASAEIFAVLASITPLVEKASIDEAYLDVSGLEKLIGPPMAVGHAIKTRIREATQLTASVGIGPNRLIAKLGSECRKPDGLMVIEPEEVLDFLAPMTIGSLRGVGPQTRKHFARMGIDNVAELRDCPPERLERHIGRRAAASFRRQALGIASSEVVPNRSRKSISKECTFETDVDGDPVLLDKLRALSAGVAKIARREGLAGQRVTLKIRFRGFETHTRQRRLTQPTYDERVMLETAWSLYQRGDLPRKPVRLIGIGLSDWADTAAQQADLFGTPGQRQANDRVLDTIDRVAGRFGAGKLQRGIRRSTGD
jgi:DNA polymerase-4